MPLPRKVTSKGSGSVGEGEVATSQKQGRGRTAPGLGQIGLLSVFFSKSHFRPNPLDTPPSPTFLADFHSLAACRKDLKNVRKFLEIDESKAFDVVYDVIFKSTLALMRAHGYRPAAMLQHKTTVEFCEAALDASWKTTLDYFDDMRQKRNRLTYEADVTIGRPEAETAITEAHRFHAALAKAVDAARLPITP